MINQQQSDVFISNKRLAEYENCSLRIIEKRLAQLVDAGLLQTHYVNKQRYIKTRWSDKIFRGEYEIANNTPAKKNGNSRNRTVENRSNRTGKLPFKKNGHNSNRYNNNKLKGDISKDISPVSRGSSKPGKRFSDTTLDDVVTSKHTMKNKTIKKKKTTSKLTKQFTCNTAALTVAEPLTQRLWQTLMNHNRVRTDLRHSAAHYPSARQTWIKHIVSLIEYYGKERVATALNWYCDNIRDKYTPIVWAAKSFSDKFVQIEAAMNRANEKLPQKVTLDKYEKDVVKRLKTFHWPKGSADYLPAVVKQSVAAYKNFRRSIKLVTGKKYYKDLLEFVLSNMFMDPHEFVYQWFEAIFWKRVSCKCSS